MSHPPPAAPSLPRCFWRAPLLRRCSRTLLAVLKQPRRSAALHLLATATRSGKRDTLRRLLVAVLATLAITLTGNASYIHAKAALAQVLLINAWGAMRADGQPHRPWPWADSHPVARLRMPRLDIEQIVLAGDSGRTMAFGPGWAEASAAPGSNGTTIISAHRDTHFDWLREIAPNDTVELESTTGVHRYRVIDMRIADSRTEQISLSANAKQLILVTCWPFDSVVSGGPLRFVVVAERVAE